MVFPKIRILVSDLLFRSSFLDRLFDQKISVSVIIHRFFDRLFDRFVQEIFTFVRRLFRSSVRSSIVSYRKSLLSFIVSSDRHFNLRSSLTGKFRSSFVRYSSSQEMMALTYFMMDEASKEAESCLDSAFITYLKLGLRGQQNAVRCGLWWAEMLKARDQYKEAASVCFRVSGTIAVSSNARASILLLLICCATNLRKYGFHLILSGDSYKKCDQMKHAIRTYKTALSVFSGTSWGLIKDHIHFQLGKWFALLGMFDVAIEHMLDILACTHQSKAAQELENRKNF